MLRSTINPKLNPCTNHHAQCMDVCALLNNMDSSHILNVLADRFSHNHMDICEAFVYSEESDFLTITNKTQAHEIEVKISRSDFKADFKKSKHSFFKCLLEGRKIATVKGFEQNETCSLRNNEFHYESYLRRKKHRPETIFETPRNGFRPWLSSVRFIKIAPTNFPNKFSFAVPEGLISIDEVPDYAGLYYVTELGAITEVKRAKFLHKEKFIKWRDLSNKFYWRNMDLRRSNRHLRKLNEKVN